MTDAIKHRRANATNRDIDELRALSRAGLTVWQSDETLHRYRGYSRYWAEQFGIRFAAPEPRSSGRQVKEHLSA